MCSCADPIVSFHTTMDEQGVFKRYFSKYYYEVWKSCPTYPVSKRKVFVPELMYNSPGQEVLQTFHDMGIEDKQQQKLSQDYSLEELPSQEIPSQEQEEMPQKPPETKKKYTQQEKNAFPKKKKKTER